MSLIVNAFRSLLCVGLVERIEKVKEIFYVWVRICGKIKYNPVKIVT